MYTVLKYIIGLDLLNCLAKFRGDTISLSRENNVGSCYYWKYFRYFQTEFVTSAVGYGQQDVVLLSCNSCRVIVPVLFVSVKPEAGWQQFSRELPRLYLYQYVELSNYGT